MAKNTTTSAYSLPREVILAVEKRATEAEMSKSELLATDLCAFYGILEYGMGKARLVLSEDEARVVVAAVTNPSLYTEQDAIRWMTTNLLYAVEDSIEMEGMAAAFDLDGAALVEKLRALPDFARLALAYWCRMMWTAAENTERWNREMDLFRGQ